MRMRMLLMVLSVLVLGACAAPMAAPPGSVTTARASSSPWWLCDPPGLWEDRR
jgi:hypothetical protein